MALIPYALTRPFLFGLDPERLGRQLFARGAVAQPLREPLLRG